MFQHSANRLKLLLCGLLLVTGSTLANTIVSVSPANSMQSVGDNFAIEIEVSGVSDLYAYQFDLQFDPSLLIVKSSTQGSFLTRAGSTVFIPGTIDNDVGLVSFITNALTGPVPGASGSGSLAEISFAAKANGLALLTLSNALLLNSSLNTIPTVDLVSGQVRLTSLTSPAPEPSSGFLYALGLFAIVTFHRSRRRRKLN